MADKKKWIGAAGLVFFTILLLLAGIRYEKGSKKNHTEIENTEKGEPAESKEMDHIIMTYQTLSISRLDHLDAVMEEVNRIAGEEIGVEVELKVSPALDSFTDYPLWISQGDQIDLMILNYQDITGYIKAHMILPMDSLLADYGDGIEQIIEEGENLSQGAVFDGKTYGVTNITERSGSGGGIWFSEDLLKEMGISVKEETIYSLDEIDEILAEIKEKYPDSYPLGQITSGATSTSYNYYCDDESSWGISGGFSTGIVKDGKICDFYETEEYKQFLQRLHEWYEKGYIFPDAAFTDESQRELYQSGIILSKPFTSMPGMAGDLGDDVVCLRTTQIRKGERGEKSGFWVIPETSKNPAAAMKFLNLMLTDTRIGNLLKWGIEGVDYVKKDDGSIRYPDGMDSTTTGYNNPMALYGDYSKIYQMQTEEERREAEKYKQLIVPSQSEYPDFVYDKTAVADKTVRVQEVVKKYIPVLESGSVDLDIYYPEFIDALNQAGMQEIIADKQEQFERYLAEKETEENRK